MQKNAKKMHVVLSYVKIFPYLCIRKVVPTTPSGSDHLLKA